MTKKEVKTELTRAEKVAIIEGGGSIGEGGVIITNVADLPEDEESIAQAEQELEQRKAKAEEAKAKKPAPKK